VKAWEIVSLVQVHHMPFQTVTSIAIAVILDLSFSSIANVKLQMEKWKMKNEFLKG
jgi:hypothetical protein